MALFFLLSNCKDPYSFKNIESKEYLTINGGIHNGPGPYFIDLGITKSPAQVAAPLDGADIMIKDQYGSTEKYIAHGNGKYQSNGTTVVGTPGNNYILEIRLKNGNVYHSTPEIMPTTPLSTDSATFQVDRESIISSENAVIYNYFINILLKTKLPKIDSVGYFRWGIDEVYLMLVNHNSGCWVSQPYCVYNITNIKNTDYSNLVLSNILLQHRPIDMTFGYGHMFNITQSCMNKKNYDYWFKVKELKDRQGSIFDTPPANIIGNMINESNPKEIVLGYFEATSQKITRVKVERGNIPDAARIDCTNYPSEFCSSCDHSPGTPEQPTWWF